jgi:hypothetical protein
VAAAPEAIEKLEGIASLAFSVRSNFLVMQFSCANIGATSSLARELMSPSSKRTERRRHKRTQNFPIFFPYL